MSVHNPWLQKPAAKARHSVGYWSKGFDEANHPMRIYQTGDTRPAAKQPALPAAFHGVFPTVQIEWNPGQDGVLLTVTNEALPGSLGRARLVYHIKWSDRDLFFYVSNLDSCTARLSSWPYIYDHEKELVVETWTY